MRVLIVDDEALVADLISDYVRNDDRVRKVFCKYDSTNVLESIEENNIDMIFLDLYMPNLIGFEILAEIRNKYEDMKVVILSSHFQTKFINKAMQLKANGFLSKSINKNEISSTLDSLSMGKVYLCKECYKELDLNKMKEANPKISISEHLTPREIEVLELIVEGQSSNQIGENLFISKETVETHKKHLYEKFGVNKVTQLVRLAIENNVI